MIWNITQQPGLLALLVIILTGTVSAQAQFLNSKANMNGPVTDGDLTDSAVASEMRLASGAINALRQLQSQTMVYNSLSDFEASHRIARVSLRTFKANLARMTDELESVVMKISDPKLRAFLINALDSYRDGVFWWSKIDRSRVVAIGELKSEFTSSSEEVFNDTIPYTVIIHWRQADQFLRKAERIISLSKCPR